ncbi:type VI secretion system Vgr family protein [Lampropedia aestuarii]|uniref:type VI secretion system Vgr family protein n=1 Tax=Lampropedia aestuarii TaxID=2562762 RepID=UPI0023EF510D|nr:type VI secretion system tip protein TssI/VgrG [Lampropedia aestuarii]
MWRHPRQDQNRDLLIVSARYEAEDNDYESRGDSLGVHFFVEVEAQPADRGFRPITPRQAPRARGPETAVVVGPAGEEIYTDEYGRVKVHFHWDRYGAKDGTDSCWIRVASTWAGSNFGGIHIPRIGQEVIVDYEYGDPDRPLITGRVYNAGQMPPWGLPANKTQSGFLTRSTSGGAAGDGLRDGTGDANALRFEDAKGQEQLWLHAQKDQLTEVENDEDKWVGNDRRKEIDRDEFNTIHRDRTEVVDRNEKINVHGWRTEEVDLDETLTVHKNRSRRVDLNENVSIGQSRTKNVSKHEKDSIGRNWSINVGRFKTETIGLAYMQNVGMAKMVNIGIAYNLNVGMTMITNVGQSRKDTIGKTHHIQVGEMYELKVGGGGGSGSSAAGDAGGASITLDGSTIRFKVGASVMVLQADGSITVNGKRIDVVGSKHIGMESERIDLN